MTMTMTWLGPNWEFEIVMSGHFSNVFRCTVWHTPMAEYGGNACLTLQSLAHHFKLAAMHQPGCATYHKCLLSQNAKRKITKELFSNVCKNHNILNPLSHPSNPWCPMSSWSASCASQSMWSCLLAVNGWHLKVSFKVMGWSQSVPVQIDLQKNTKN